MELSEYIDKKKQSLEDGKFKLGSLNRHIETVLASREKSEKELEKKQASLDKLLEIEAEIVRLEGVIEESQSKLDVAIEEGRKFTVEETAEVTFIELCREEIEDLRKQGVKVYYNR